MGPRRIYLDNAATSFPKPRAVTEAMMCYAQMLGASAGRGGYSEAVETGRLINETRQLLKRFLHAESANHFIFTLNCTDALNLAIKGLIDPAGKGHVICTAIDHNSILRPINAMVDYGWIEKTVVPVDPTTGLVDPQDIRRAIRSDTKLIAITHGSNVTGTIQPVRTIGRIAREHAVPFVVDAAQSVGHVPIDVQADCIDLLAAPGHKALLGPLGTGFLYIRPGLEKMLRPLREGGTGSASEHPVQPLMMPDRYEPGSHNAIGIIGLAEGVKWLMEKSIEKVQIEEQELVRAFIDGVEGVPGLRFFGPPSDSDRIGVFSVRIDGIEPNELANHLEEQFGLLTRAGLHCAPHIHETIGTASTGGTTRFSFSPFVTLADVKSATDALAQLAEAHVAV
ncbi:MAG: aminotransferase class V-fold PLP-dependent enzyme [Tepidisphaeraceae bacterium]